MTEFLQHLDQEAAARRQLAADVPEAERCRDCAGSGSVTRYVLPGVTGPDECKSCKGTGRRP